MGKRQRSPTLEGKTGAAGVALLHQLSSAAGFIFRDLGGIDLGIDAAVEIFHDGRTHGYVLLQIKCTGSRPRTHVNSSASIKKVVNATTLLSYWRSLHAPVLLVQTLLDSNALKKGLFIATDLYAVDASEESIEATGTTIKWKLNCSAELRLLDARSIDSLNEFKRFLIEVRSNEDAGAEKNALWLSNRALDAADFEAARMAIETYVKKKRGWAIIQKCRIERREGKWKPEKTESALKGYASNQDLDEGRDALREIGYSYLVAAMDSWCCSGDGRAAKIDAVASCTTALEKLTEWKNNVSGWDGPNYILYAQLVSQVMQRSADTTAMHESAAELMYCLKDRLTKRGGKVPLKANMTLWRYALVAGKCEIAEDWMHKAWKAFAHEARLPDEWKGRSPQQFADAMLLRSWTLARTNEQGARQLFEAAKTAINGVLQYRELEFWMRAASQDYPSLLACDPARPNKIPG